MTTDTTAHKHKHYYRQGETNNTTITQLPIVTSTTPSDKLVIVQNDVTSQISVSDLESSTIIPQLELQGRITGSAQAIANNDTGVLIQLGDTINTPKVSPNIYPESNVNNVANGKDNAEDII